MDKTEVSALIEAHGFTDYKFIDPGRDILVAEWVRFKCMFGCGSYGKRGSCPPAVPPVEECREMLGGYGAGAIFHFPLDPPDRAEIQRQAKRLGELERAVFLAGYYKTFLLQVTTCALCKDCPAGSAREKCVGDARPTPEAMGIDVYQTARNAGFPINVVRAEGERIDRYAFLLIE